MDIDRTKRRIEPTELSLRTLLEKLPILMRGVDDSVLDGVIYFRLDSNKWQELKGALIDYGLSLQQRPLGELVPVLKEMRDCDLRTQRWLPHGIEPLQSRIRHALLESGIGELRDLADVRVIDIQRLAGFGSQSIQTLLGFLVEVGVSVPPRDRVPSQTAIFDGLTTQSPHTKNLRVKSFVIPEVEAESLVDSILSGDPAPEPEGEEIGPNFLANSVMLKDLALLAQWELYKGKSTVLGEIFAYTPKSHTPSEIRAATSRLSSIDMAGLMPATPKIVDLIDEMLEGFDEKGQYIMTKRVFSLDPLTLDYLGQELGVTRERIRQIQNRIERKIRWKLTCHQFAPIKWVAMEFRGRIGNLAPLEHPLTAKIIGELLPGERQSHHIQMLLNLAGYEISEGWLSTTNLDRTKSHINSLLVEAADEFGVLPENHEVDTLKQLGVKSEFHQTVLASLTKISKRVGRYVTWQNSVVDKAVTILAIREKPADIHTLISEMNESYNAVGARDRLSADPRVMRVNKTEFGLRAWGLEEYSGITEEICERIERRGGSADLEGLVAEIVSTFGVAENSVRLYCSSPMFVVKDGIIALSSAEDRPEISEDITSVKGAYKPSPNEVSILVSVDKDTLRGSGRSLVPALAAALQVQPGGERTYQGHDGSVRITWPMTSALGGSRGSIRDFARSLNAREGDRVLLVFDTEQITVKYSLPRLLGGSRFGVKG